LTSVDNTIAAADASSTNVLITALAPVKNYHAPFLREAFGSIFAQSVPAWRLIVIIERGADAALLAELARIREDSRTSVIFNQGRGLAGAFNSGMRAARTEFVSILLGDDLWAPSAVEALTAQIRDFSAVDFHHSGLRVIDDVGQSISGVRHPPEHVTPADFIAGSPVKHLLCWRREKALSFGGMDESMNDVGPDDYDFPWTMLEHGATFRRIDQCLYIYRDHRQGERLTTHLPRSTHVRELRRIFAKHRVPRELAEERVRRAQRDYLRQCLYRNRFDRWLREKIIGIDSQRGWRLPMKWKPADIRAAAPAPIRGLDETD
jgi:glycosyltransferase involved in cell wall biosynthesis